MEQLNRIELRGAVGSVRLQTFSEARVARFTLATNYAYKDKNGEAVIETSWHNVVASKGSKVYVQGRLRYQKYTGSDGVERLATDIVASRLVILDDESQIHYEM